MAEPAARPTSADRIRAALWFAEHGFGVFPVWGTTAGGACRCPLGAACENAGKHPSTTNGFRDATSDAGRITTMLSVHHDPNYGLVCPDGVFVLDVDGDGIERLEGLERELGPLPPTLKTKTANGWHVFLRWPLDYPRPIGQLWGFVTRWGSGRDAGYVIGPRSVHRSGVAYAPGGVFDIATLPDAWARNVVESKAQPDDAFITISAGGYELPDFGYTGERYPEILRYVSSRYKRGLSEDEIWVGVRDVLAPRFEHGLTEAELRSRFERAWKRTPERLGPPDPAPLTEEDVATRGVPVTPAATAWPEPPAEAAFHGVIGEIVRAVAPATEADPVGILASLLTMAGGCMGHLSSFYQGSAHGPNIFTVLVGDSSSGRKGTAGSVARDVMNAAYPDWSKLIVAGLGSGEGLVGHLKAIEQNEHRAVVIESEFGRLLTVMAREGSTLSPIVRDAWDGVPMGRFLARDQALVSWHHVAINAHITSVELRQKLSNVDAANGFGNRFLWIAVRRTQLVPFPESPRRLVADELTEALGFAIEAANRPQELRWAHDAADRWEALYARLTAVRRTGLLGALTARAEAQIARLALLYALLDRAPAVGVVHLAAAEALWEYAERSARHVFGESTGNRHADQLLAMVADGPVPWNDAKRELGLRTAADLSDAVAVLTGIGAVEIVLVPPDKGGRPARVITAAGWSAKGAKGAKNAAGAQENGLESEEKTA